MRGGNHAGVAGGGGAGSKKSEWQGSVAPERRRAAVADHLLDVGEHDAALVDVALIGEMQVQRVAAHLHVARGFGK